MFKKIANSLASPFPYFSFIPNNAMDEESIDIKELARSCIELRKAIEAECKNAMAEAKATENELNNFVRQYLHREFGYY